MKYLSILKNKNLSKETCLLRVDLNIEDMNPSNLRIQAILPTVKFLIDKGAKIIILSHRGRPNGKNKKLSLKPFMKILFKSLKKPISFIELNGKDSAKVKNSKPGSIFLLENLRFFNGEEKNDPIFAKKLADLGTFYINDAFAVSHRKNASIEAITKYLPSYAGFQLEKEIENLKSVMGKPKKPLILIMGGAKISDKLSLVNSFIKKSDYFLIGGGIANTFLAALGMPIGDSLYEKDMTLEARKILKQAPKKIFLPIDFAVDKKQILDIGTKTVKLYDKKIQSAKTIIWNGPMGKFEDKKFAKGTQEIAKAILRNKKAKIIIGGGETIASLQPKTKNYKPKTNVFLSTGGGAMLEYLSGENLPGIEALQQNSLKIYGKQ
ncbi:MAG: phosphoglycerate kinase [Candidatus Paceibacterota bacterium]|jgi:phosphoglycerate kinase